MSLAEKAGQVILPFYTGLDHEAQAAMVERFHLAGSMIMADNVPGTAAGLVDVHALAAVTRRLDQASRAGGRTWPGLIGVDQEGGAVSRAGAPLTRWPTPMSYGAAGSVPLATEAGAGWRQNWHRWVSPWTSHRPPTSRSVPPIPPSARGPCPPIPVPRQR
jgi:beta-N-acetylhexosaminidase